MNIKAFLKDYGLLCLAIAALIFVSVLGVSGFNNLRNNGNSLYRDGFLAIEHLYEVHIALQTQHTVVNAAPAELDMNLLAEKKALFEELAPQVLQQLTDLAQGTSFESSIAAYDDYVTHSAKVFEFASFFAQDQAQAVLADNVRPLFAELEQAVEDMHVLAQESANGSLSEMSDTSQHITYLMLGISVVLIFVVSGIGAYLGYLQTQQMRQTRKLIEGVRGVMSHVTQATGELGANFKNVSQSAQQMREGVGSSTQMANQTSENVTAISAAIEEMASSTVQIRDQAVQTKDLSGRVTTEMQVAGEAVNKMTNSVEQITKFVEVIQGIADQTNLLALNAAIEAARAGEMGLGFAVVADEVRKLASAANSAAGDIVDQVGSIQGVTKQVSSTIDVAQESIAKTQEMADSVSRSVAEQNAATQDIAHSIDNVSSASTRIAHEMSGVNDQAISVDENSVHAVSRVSELDNLAKDLNRKVDSFIERVL